MKGVGENMPVYGYLRVSSKRQMDGSGFGRQKATIKRFAKSKRLVIDEWFKEQVSGTKDEDEREVFAAMVSQLLATNGDNGQKVLVVERLDRLARQLMVQEQLLVYLVSKGITLYSADTAENVTEAIMADPMKKAMVQMQGVFAELEKSQLVRKLRKGRQVKRALTGRCEGLPPYGTTPEESAIIKRIGYLRRKPKYGKRRTYQAIADILNGEGVPTRLGKKWRAVQIWRIVNRKGKRA
jgi:DNA invertase Pin-like site-specific DNA recombinase